MQLVIKRVFDAPSPLENSSDNPKFEEWALVKNPKREEYDKALTLCAKNLAYPIITSSRDNRYLLLREPSPGCDFLVWYHSPAALEAYFRVRGARSSEYQAIIDLIRQINANEYAENYSWQIVNEAKEEIDSNSGYLIYSIPTMLQFLEDLREAVIHTAAIEIEGEGVSMMLEDVEVVLERIKETSQYRSIPITLRL